MERRFVLFLVLSFAILVGSQYLFSPRRNGPQGEPPVAREDGVPKGKPGEKRAEQAAKKPAEIPGEKPKPKVEEKPAPARAKPAEKPPKVVPPEPETREKWVTLGSADPKEPYRMLVTLTNRGAAVALVELNSARYHDLDDAKGEMYDRTGYLGRIVPRPGPQEPPGPKTAKLPGGCLVQVVGPGTPAADAGLEPGDLIKEIKELDRDRITPITGAKDLRALLDGTRPGDRIELTVSREGKELAEPLQATLTQRPLAVIRPEDEDHLSFLMGLSRIDEEERPADVDGEEKEAKAEDDRDRPAARSKEIDGAALRAVNWEITESSPSRVTFVRKLPQKKLEVSKTYELAEVPPESADDPSYKAYHLTLEVKIRNLDDKKHEVAYELDGPNGLPIEGWWYSHKVSREMWSSVGVRDVAVMYGGETVPDLVGCVKIAEDKVESLPWRTEEPLIFIGVDAQYFSAVLIPQREVAGETWFAESRPMTLGEVDPERKLLANTSFRVTSKVHELAPEGSLSRRFEIFAGPKNPDLLDQYGLGELVYYGWFGVVARPLLMILHTFYAVVQNYGLAIIMLTVLVRLCMFPLSRKQTLNALKMQELQPEIKKIQEKYKKDMEGRTKAQQELFRKHNYNPLGGCLVMFIQLPIFVALYRSLMVDVELRQAPLLSDAIRWCSNLAAPDMFFDWSGFMPGLIKNGIGLFGLGPYFNILPIATVILFLWQQKKLMPPPADEQAAMQQNIMKYMMIFMGLLFFKVASGLCIYFIASSLWGLGERRFLPKPDKDATQTRDKPQPKSKPAPPRSSANGDGAPARKKKKRKRSRGKR